MQKKDREWDSCRSVKQRKRERPDSLESVITQFHALLFVAFEFVYLSIKLVKSNNWDSRSLFFLFSDLISLGSCFRCPQP